MLGGKRGPGWRGEELAAPRGAVGIALGSAGAELLHTQRLSGPERPRLRVTRRYRGPGAEPLPSPLRPFQQPQLEVPSCWEGWGCWPVLESEPHGRFVALSLSPGRQLDVPQSPLKLGFRSGSRLGLLQVRGWDDMDVPVLASPEALWDAAFGAEWAVTGSAGASLPQPHSELVARAWHLCPGAPQIPSRGATGDSTEPHRRLSPRKPRLGTGRTKPH